MNERKFERMRTIFYSMNKVFINTSVKMIEMLRYEIIQYTDHFL